MKTTRILAVVLALITVATLALSFSTSAAEYTVDLEGKTDVLAGKESYINTPFEPGSDFMMTDGTYAADKGGKVYFNKKWVGSTTQAASTCEDPQNSYALVGGATAKYAYSFEWSFLNCDVTSFKLFFNNENYYGTAEGITATAATFPYWQLDAEFQILVSQDGGQTYSIAYKSTPYTLDENGDVKTCSAFPITSGGNTQYFEITDPVTGAVTGCYMMIEGEFDKEYKGVTDIVYAAVQSRRNSKKITVDDKQVSVISSAAFNWAVRISEFDVYGTAYEVDSSATTAAATTAAPVTTKKAETTKAPTTTKAPETTAVPAETTKAAETKTGCGSVAAVGVAAVVTVLGTAIIRKKH